MEYGSVSQPGVSVPLRGPQEQSRGYGSLQLSELTFRNFEHLHEIKHGQPLTVQRVKLGPAREC